MFEFDPAKSETNRVKHGIDFDEAQALWKDERRVVAPTGVKAPEERWLITGRIGDPIWTAVVTYRGEAIRLISVRRARKDEVEAYGRQAD